MGVGVKDSVKAVLRSMGWELGRINPGTANKYVWLQCQQIRTILDIGANVGQFAGKLHGLLPDARIYSFEPLPDCYQQLVQSMSEAPAFQAFNFAIGDDEGEVDMHRSEFAPSSSILPMGEGHKDWVPYSAQTRIERIKVKRLDDVAPDLKLEDNLLVKIDVQGFEDRVIRGGRNTLSRAHVIIVETSFQSLYDGQPLFSDVFDSLRDLGFDYHGDLDQFRHRATGCVMQADSIFVKRGRLIPVPAAASGNGKH